jgi:hypothetical protein
MHPASRMRRRRITMNPRCVSGYMRVLHAREMPADIRSEASPPFGARGQNRPSLVSGRSVARRADSIPASAIASIGASGRGVRTSSAILRHGNDTHHHQLHPQRNVTQRIQDAAKPRGLLRLDRRAGRHTIGRNSALENAPFPDDRDGAVWGERVARWGCSSVHGAARVDC